LRVATFTWSGVRRSASDGYCCNHWIVATADIITALAIVALSLSLALALTRLLKLFSHSHHTQLDTERSIKKNTKILGSPPKKKNNHRKGTVQDHEVHNVF